MEYMQDNGGIQNRNNMTPKNQFRIEGETVHILLKDGGGQETLIDLRDWPVVQNYDWFMVRKGKMLYAATYFEHKSGVKKLIYLHDLVFAMHADGRDQWPN